VHWGCYYATALDIEVDPQRRCFGCRESDFALQRLVECRALETELVRLIALRWHSCGSAVRLVLQVGLEKKKTQKLAVHAGAGAHDSGEKRNVKDQAPAPGLIPKIAPNLLIAAQLACACRHFMLRAYRVSGRAEQRLQYAHHPIMRLGCTCTRSQSQVCRERVLFIKKITPRAPTGPKHAEAG